MSSTHEISPTMSISSFVSSSSSSGEDTGSSEVGDNEDTDEDSDENYIDEEPLLKYRRLKSSVTEILSGGKTTQPDSASCLSFTLDFKSEAYASMAHLNKSINSWPSM